MSQNGVFYALLTPINYWDLWTPECSIPACASAQKTPSKAGSNQAVQTQGSALSFLVMNAVLAFLKFSHPFEYSLKSYYVMQENTNKTTAEELIPSICFISIFIAAANYGALQAGNSM